MIDYINIYIKYYEINRLIAVKKIKEILINNNNIDSPLDETGLIINNEYINYKKNNIIFDEDYKELIKLFNNRTVKFRRDSRLQVINKQLKPLFDSIKNKKCTFSIFIKNLAKEEAFSKTIEYFFENHAVYKLMYMNNKFDGYKHMPQFDIYKFDTDVYDSKIYFELKDIVYPNTTLVKNKPPSKIKKLKTINSFKINKDYKKGFEKDELYNYLSLDYINSKKTTQEDFKNVFLKKFDDHNSQLHFSCNSELAALLLFSINEKKIFENFTYVNIENSKKIFTLNNIPFKEKNIANSKKNALDKEEYIHKVETIIKKIDSISDIKC